MTNVTRCLYFKSACLSNGAGVAKRAGPVEEWDPKGPSGTVCEQAHGVRRTPAQAPDLGRVAENSCDLLSCGLF